MIDTIQGFSQSFSLKDQNRFICQSAPVRLATGEEVGSPKYYCNEVRGIKFDFYPSSNRLTFHTSLPKLVHGTSLFEVKPSDLPAVRDRLSERFNEAGVVGDPMAFTLSRVDFCANLEVAYHPSDYIMALSDLSFSRRDKRDIAHENLSFRNSRRELAIYNKVREVRETEKSNAPVFELVRDREENILRVENRLRNTKAVYRELGKVALADIFDLELSRKELVKEYETLTRLDSEQITLNFEDNLKQLRAIQRERPYRAFDYFLRLRGLERFLIEFGHDWDLIQEFLFEAFPRRTAYRLLSQIKSEQTYIQPEQKRRLIEEVREKLKKVA